MTEDEIWNALRRMVESIGRELAADKKRREDAERFIRESNEWYSRIKSDQP